MKKNKPSALQAWKMLLLSMPKGIAAFVTIVAGLSVSLPLSVFLIGLPLLAETLLLGRRMIEAESCNVENWKNSAARQQSAEQDERKLPQREWAGWRNLLAVLGQGRYYRSILYGVLQLPIGIAAFTMAVVLPVTAWAVMLSPLAYQISVKLFAYELFMDDVVMGQLLPNWTGFERSWLIAGIGAVWVLLMPMILRTMGRMYTAWVLAVAGPAEAKTIAVKNGAEQAGLRPQWIDAVSEPVDPVIAAQSPEPSSASRQYA